MTDQLTAGPTPGPWTRNELGDVVDLTGKNVPFRNLTIRMSSDATRMAEAEANTDLVAASWETAAQRDRLVKVNEGLVEAIEQGLVKDCTCPSCCHFRAALDEACKS